MASTPDDHADSLPPETPGTIEQTDEQFDGRARRGSVEAVDGSDAKEPVDGPGIGGGTAGTGGDNKVQDDLDR